MIQSARDGQTAVYAAMPGLFVLIWSGGFIAAKAGLAHADAMTFLTLRFAIVAILLAAIALATGAPFPRSRAALGHIAVSGILTQACYFAGIWLAMKHGIGAGTSALISGLQPVLTVLAARALLGERVVRHQWLGFVLGVVGVALVVQHKLAQGLGTPAGVFLTVFALVGITAGTLYQKRFCPTVDPRSGGAVQVASAALVVALPALLFEDGHIAWQPRFVMALGYMVVGPSLVALTLLTLMIRRNQASRVGSMFFLIPPTSVILAHLLLNEPVGPVTVAGMVVAVIGVALVVGRARGRREP